MNVAEVLRELHFDLFAIARNDIFDFSVSCFGWSKILEMFFRTASFKIAMPRKALILPLKARLIILPVKSSNKGIFAAFRRLVKNESPRKSVYIIPKDWTRTTE